MSLNPTVRRRGVDRIGPIRSDPRSGQNADRIGFHNSTDPIRDPDGGSLKIGAIRSIDPTTTFRFLLATLYWQRCLPNGSCKESGRLGQAKSSLTRIK
jgi:hypothetical protein